MKILYKPWLHVTFLILFPFAIFWKSFLPDMAPMTSDTNIAEFTRASEALKEHGMHQGPWVNTWWLGFGNDSAASRFPNFQDLALMFIDPVTSTKFRIPFFQALAGVSAYILGLYVFKNKLPAFIMGMGWMAMGTIWTNIPGGHDGKMFALAIAPWVFFGLWMVKEDNEKKA